MGPEYSWINGYFVHKNDAKVNITDLAIQRGYGIFDFFKTINFRPVFLDNHLRRFYHSLSAMRLEITIDAEAFKQIFQELMQKNNLGDSGIRITVTGGYSPDGYTLTSPNILISQIPFKYDPAVFDKGINLVTYKYQRQLPQIKTIDYLHSIWLQPFIKEKGADDVLYHHNSHIRECPRSNIFIVSEHDEVLTPSHGILEGINRNKILSFSEFNAKEEKITLDHLRASKEVFMTSTTKNVLPVFQVNGKMIGNGKPGEITQAIFEQLVKSQMNE